jgi:hypothetical protein
MFVTANGGTVPQSTWQNYKGVYHQNLETLENVLYPVLDENIIDDGSCEYPVYGCTDPNALNYNPEAGIDDGSCEYQGLTAVVIDEI